MHGLRIGHYTNTHDATGASVFLFEHAAIAAYALCGSAPATHELSTIALETSVTHINALALFGGSALGLPAVQGVHRWLVEQGAGWLTPHGRVPIVPAAAIYDLVIGNAVPPSAEGVYQACLQATSENHATGRIGAGTGASVGKLDPTARRMTGGIGRAEMVLPSGAVVLVYAVVNSVGDVYDGDTIIAGAVNTADEFINCQQCVLQGDSHHPSASANTTLVAVFTDACFSAIELKRIAKMAVAGMGRAISPVFTHYDGDIVFAVSLGKQTADELVVGTAAAELTRQAIINAVAHADIIGNM